MKKLIIVICTIIFLFCLINEKEIKIIGFYQNNNILEMNSLFFEKDKKASYYKIYIYSDNDELIDIKKTKNNYYRLNFINKIQEKMYIKIISYNNKNRERRKSDKYYIEWEKAYLQVEDNKVFILNNKDNNYEIFIKDNNHFLEIKTNTDLSDYDNAVIYLYEDNVLINKFYYIATSNNKIVYPIANSTIYVSDFYIQVNSEFQCLAILKNDDFTRRFNSCEVLITKDLIKENTKHELTVQYFYPDSLFPLEEEKIIFNTKKNNLLPVISNKESGEILKNALIELKSPNNGKIYYTLDGSKPTCNNILYEEAIQISDDTILKTIVIDGNDISEISTFEYKVIEKVPLVYLSPSRQTKNLGVKRAGYSSEKIEMNKLAVILEKKLIEHGIRVYRAEQAIDLSERVKESLQMDSDIYLALHSNASTSGYPKEGKARGIQSYIASPESPILEFANIVQEEIMSIYEGPTNRSGVKYGTQTKMMFEIDENNVKNGILLEIGFHDNYEDALWIVNNLEQIADAISSAVVKYFEM